MSNLQSKRTLLSEPTVLLDKKSSHVLSNSLPTEVQNSEIAGNGIDVTSQKISQE